MEENKITTALSLSEEIIKNIESNEIPLEDICLKAERLAGILDDDKNVENFRDFSLKVKQLKNTYDTLRVSAVIVPEESIRTMEKMNNLQEAIQGIKMAVHAYVSNNWHEMKFSSIPENIFEKTRIRVDRMLSEIVPDAAKKYLSIYENLKSSNAEDWSNAVHLCRRSSILPSIQSALSVPL